MSAHQMLVSLIDEANGIEPVEQTDPWGDVIVTLGPRTGDAILADIAASPRFCPTMKAAVRAAWHALGTPYDDGVASELAAALGRAFTQEVSG